MNEGSGETAPWLAYMISAITFLVKTAFSSKWF